jgi:hypothetical protein
VEHGSAKCTVDGFPFTIVPVFFIVLSDQAVAEAFGDDRGRLDDNDVTVVVNCVLCS